MKNRQKALEWFRKRIQSVPMPGAKAMYEEAIKALEKPEIVQCKDCKFAHLTYSGECKYCDIWWSDEAHYMDGDYFCASAERRVEHDE